MPSGELDADHASEMLLVAGLTTSLDGRVFGAHRHNRPDDLLRRGVGGTSGATARSPANERCSGCGEVDRVDENEFVVCLLVSLLAVGVVKVVDRPLGPRAHLGGGGSLVCAALTKRESSQFGELCGNACGERHLISASRHPGLHALLAFLPGASLASPTFMSRRQTPQSPRLAPVLVCARARSP